MGMAFEAVFSEGHVSIDLSPKFSSIRAKVYSM